VTGRRRETHDTWTLRLEPAGDASLPAFSPGQFAMLYAFGAGEAPISISAMDGVALVHTIRAVGAVTRALCAAGAGDLLGVRGPFGHPWPLEAAVGRDVVLVAGGLGLPPLRPVLAAVLAARQRFGNVTLLYGARTPADIVFGDELARWAGRADLQVAVTVDAPAAGWDGRVGLVTRLVEDAELDPGRSVAMVCGPEPMMRFGAAALLERRLAPADVWLSLERSMVCGIGHCGHCQLGPLFVCKDGPVVRHDVAEPLLAVAEL